MPVKKSAVKSPVSKVQSGKKRTGANNPELEKLVTELNKKFGENAVNIGFKKNNDGSAFHIKRIPTGSFTLDLALGGGIPVGRFTQISGALSSTKTTQTAHIIKKAQSLGYTCAYVDVEGTTDDPFLQDIGVDTDSLIYMNPDSLEEATEAILTMQKSGLVQVAALDSIAALSSNKEQASTMEDSVRMGITQSLMGEFCRKYQMNNNRLVRENKEPFTVIAINQLREKIGAYGDPEYTPGGRALGFTASVDIRLRRGDWITEGTGDKKAFVGQVVKFKIEKNKTYRRMQSGEFDFYFDDNNAGVPMYYNDVIKEVIACGVEWGVIQRSGSWFVYEDTRCQGLGALVDTLRNNEDVLKSIQDKIFFLVTKKGE